MIQRDVGAKANDGMVYDYAYDGIGNRTSYQVASSKTDFQYNKLNQIINAGFEYDAYGNMTKAPGANYKYDLQNRLVEVKKNGVTVKYGYDPIGQRIKSEVISDGKAKNTEFVMSGMIEYARSESGNAIFCTLGLDIAGSLPITGAVGAVLATSSNADTLQYFYDGNGNVTKLIGGNGNVASSIAYSPFGTVIDKASKNPEKAIFAFSTKTADESGLNYYGFRFFDGKLGRWLTRDPIEEGGGRNLYCFVLNNCITQIDSLGLKSTDVTISCTAKALALIVLEARIVLLSNKISALRIEQAALAAAIVAEASALTLLSALQSAASLGLIIVRTGLDTCNKYNADHQNEECFVPIDCYPYQYAVWQQEALLAELQYNIDLHHDWISSLSSKIAGVEYDIINAEQEMFNLEKEYNATKAIPCTWWPF